MSKEKHLRTRVTSNASSLHLATPAYVAAFYLIGMLTMLFSLSMLPPIAVALYFQDGGVYPFLATFILTFIGGGLCWLPFRSVQLELRKRDGFLVVVGFWLLISLLGALPFNFANNPHLPYVDAVFESVSGLTTTGATVMSGLDNLPHSILYYRSQLNFLGGMGIVVLAVALLPMLGIGGMQLYVAETPGPMKNDKLTPRVTETAKRLWMIYAGITLLCVLSFWAAGMSLFDAINHAFATMALGGFSTHDANIGFFESNRIEWVAGIFSFIAGINFALHFTAWRSRSIREYLRDQEFLLYCAVMVVIVLVTWLMLFSQGSFTGMRTFSHAFFQSLSVATDNGLVTTGYPAEWPAFIPVFLVLASFFGGCAGSTCGGIKAIRFLLLYKISVQELKYLIHPNAVIATRIGNRTIEPRVMTAVLGFYFLYIFSYCLFSLLVMATGVDVVTAFGSVAGTLNNMGIGLGETSSNFGVLSDTATWLLSLSMLVGRLEVFPLLLLIHPDFWRR